ncbi:hypothetical protein D3C84_1037630 [compost metagenome]
MGQVHVANAFLIVATNLFPFLVGVGEKPHYVMDHASHSSCFTIAPQRSAYGPKWPSK